MTPEEVSKALYDIASDAQSQGYGAAIALADQIWAEYTSLLEDNKAFRQKRTSAASAPIPYLEWAKSKSPFYGEDVVLEKYLGGEEF